MTIKKYKAGFTMVELIIVIAIIAILAGIIFVAINPAKRFADTRNTRRWADISNTLDAILKYQVDNAGTHAAGVPTADGNNYLIGTDSGDCSTFTCENPTGTTITLQAACKNLAPGIAPDYISSIPIDPRGGAYGSAAKTGYYISQGTAGRVTLGACSPELSETISVSR